MKPLRLLVALLILLGLGGAVWYSEKNPPQPKSEFKTEKVISVAEEQFRRIRIARPAGETLAVEKGEADKWQITEPQAYTADESSMSSLVTNLASLNAEQVVAENNTDWKTYGLDPGKLRVHVSLKDGKDIKLALGDEAPTSSAVYARLEGDARLFTVPSYVKSSLDKSVLDLRDKRLLPFDSEKVSRVTLTTAKQVLEFGRAGSTWQIVKPRPLRADTFAVEDLVRSAREANFESAVEGSQKFPPAYATFEAVDAAGVHRLTISKGKENVYYARTTAVPGVYKVGSTLAEGLNKKLEDLRNKKLWDFGWSDPQKVEARDGDFRLILEKKGEKWLAGNKELPSDKVQTLLDSLRNLTAKAFTADEAAAQRRFGLDKPIADARVTSDEGKRVERVVLAAGRESRYYAARESEPATYEIEKTSYESFQKALAGLK